jgi:hypothetical protein
MADTKKKKRIRYRTPRGKGIWLALSTPDTKFDKSQDGTGAVYKATLRLEGEEAQKLAAFLDTKAQECFEIEKQKLIEAGNKVAAKQIQLGVPYKEEMTNPEGDEDPMPTGALLFTFKMPARVKPKRLQVQGQPPKYIDLKPLVVGPDLKPLNADVWGGSEIVVSYEINSYFVASSKTAGASLRLVGVQVLKLRGPGQADASELFDAYEDEDAPAETPASADGAAPMTDGADQEF